MVNKLFHTLEQNFDFGGVLPLKRFNYGGAMGCSLDLDDIYYI